MAEITSWKLMEVNDKINCWYEITHKVMKPSMSWWHRSYLVVRWRFWFFKHEVPWVTSPCIITLWNPSRNTINWTKNFENKENKYFVKFFFYSKLLNQSNDFKPIIWTYMGYACPQNHEIWPPFLSASFPCVSACHRNSLRKWHLNLLHPEC